MKYVNYTTLLVVFMTYFPVFANRLEQAAVKSQSVLLSLGQVTSVVGVLVGGIILSLGGGQTGRTILMSGVIGAAAVFGGPALIEVLKGVFS